MIVGLSVSVKCLKNFFIGVVDGSLLHQTVVSGRSIGLNYSYSPYFSPILWTATTTLTWRHLVQPPVTQGGGAPPDGPPTQTPTPTNPPTNGCPSAKDRPMDVEWGGWVDLVVTAAVVIFNDNPELYYCCRRCCCYDQTFRGEYSTTNGKASLRFNSPRCACHQSHQQIREKVLISPIFL